MKQGFIVSLFPCVLVQWIQICVDTPPIDPPNQNPLIDVYLADQTTARFEEDSDIFMNKGDMKELRKLLTLQGEK